MEMHDIINGVFEFAGGILLWLNVFRLYKDKKIMGVHIAPVALFTSWGFWNLYFYPVVGCWWSFVAGLIVVTANFTWLCQIVYYGGRKNNG